MARTPRDQVCPVCNGTTQMPCPDELRNMAMQYGWWNYNVEKDTIACRNCGGQYQFGKPTGLVPMDDEGKPCEHNYAASAGQWRCTTNYSCALCGDQFMIDSGD
jgi:hypothetical protein